MENHIKEFNDHSGYGAFMSQNPKRAVVSWCASDNEVHFDNIPPLVDMHYSVYEEPSAAKGGEKSQELQYSYFMYKSDLEKIKYESPYPGVILVNGEFVEGVSNMVFQTTTYNGNDIFYINGISSELLDPLKDDITVGIYNYVAPQELEPVIPLRGATNYIPPHDKFVRADAILKEVVSEPEIVK